MKSKLILIEYVRKFQKGGLMKKKILSILGVLVLVFTAGADIGSAASYHIGPGDTLEISVWKDESLSRTLVVPPDGIISFPLIGDINITNLTVKGLRRIVTKKLSEYVADVTVTVMLAEINSLKAYVIGKVNNPGVFAINMDTNVMQLLSMAGGLNPFASAGNIFVLRQQNKSSVKIPFNYKQVAGGKNLEQNILLQRGDVIVVP
jgi:polysaccharide export outer membrane protein